LDADSGEEITIDAYQSTQRYGESRTFQAKAPGEHILSLVSTGQRNQSSQGTAFAIASLEVLPPVRQSNLGLILLMVVSVELVGVLLSLLLGKALFAGLARKMTTKRSILLSLIIYAVIAVWGFFLNSVVEFWFLAWMVAVVQGGSQALSRSLYSTLSPASKSGEFFSLFGFMDKMAGLIGPALFIWAVAVFGSSRPAVLSIIVMFILGGLVLMLVNVDEGRRVAQMEDAEVLG
jgi:MFS-type transporter involved in bile tolerance (Atg22 family)